MSREPIPQHDALKLQLAAIAGNEPESSYLELRTLRDGQPGPRRFVRVRELRQAADAALELARDFDVFVGAAPRTCQDGTARAVARCWALWGDLDSETAVLALRDFGPLPSVVVRSGSGGVHAYWPLQAPLAPEWAQRANRRLARALGGDMAATDPARILRPAGTLNHKHSPPRLVTCTRLELDVLTFEEVVGGLADSDHYAPRPMVPPRSSGSRGSSLDGLVRRVREARPPAGGQAGERNAVLFWAACRLAERDVDQAKGTALLRNAALEAGLPDQEIDRTLRSALMRTAA